MNVEWLVELEDEYDEAIRKMDLLEGEVISFISLNKKA